MRIMSVLFILGVGLISLSITVASSSSLSHIQPNQSEDAQEIVSLVNDLGSEDIQTVRRAISHLRHHSSNQVVFMAVQPLINLIEKKNGVDSLTRAQAIHTLGVIGMIRGPQAGRREIDKIILQLSESDNELIRLSCVYTLGRTRWESVRQTLIETEQSDPSALVRLAACNALRTSTNGSFNSATCGIEDEQSPMTSRFQEVQSSSSTPTSDAMYFWAKSHLLAPID